MLSSASKNKNLPLFPEDQIPTEDGPLWYESMARKAGYDLIAGIDEAGRGPLAGPVVAAAVILPKEISLEGVKDSKQMTEKAREKAFWVINEKAIAIGIGVVSHKIIDKKNILIATLEAMKNATRFLYPLPDYLFVDGINKIPISIPQMCLKKGDQKSLSISAASVIAKVYRDRIMSSYHENYPFYNFIKNKGYGTAQHLSAVRENGPSPIHRLTFKGAK